MDPKEQELHNKRVENLKELRQLQDDLHDVIQSQKYEQEELDRLHTSIIKKQKENKKILTDIKKLSNKGNVSNNKNVDVSIDKSLHRFNTNLNKSTNLLIDLNRKLRSISKIPNMVGGEVKSNRNSFHNSGAYKRNFDNPTSVKNEDGEYSLRTRIKLFKAQMKYQRVMDQIREKEARKEQIRLDRDEAFRIKTETKVFKAQMKYQRVMEQIRNKDARDKQKEENIKQRLIDRDEKERIRVNTKLFKAQMKHQRVMEQIREKEARDKLRTEIKIFNSMMKHQRVMDQHKAREGKKYLTGLKKQYNEEQKLQKEQLKFKSHPVNMIGGAPERFTQRLEKSRVGRVVSHLGGFAKKSTNFKEKFKHNYFANENAVKQGLMKDPGKMGMAFKSMNQTLGPAIASVRGMSAAMAGLSAAAVVVGATVAIVAVVVVGAIVAIALVVKAIVDMNQSLADLGKKAGTSANQITNMVNASRQLANQFEKTSALGTTFLKVLELQVDYQKELGGLMMSGGISKTYDSMLESLMLITANLGLSVQEASNLNLVSLALGSNFNSMVHGISGVMMAMEDGTGVILDWRNVFKELSNIPLDIAAGFKGTTQEMVLLVQKSKMLGRSLKDIDGFGNKLIDVESSLKDEMEARIIYGKNINLDAARYYQMIGRTDLMFESILEQAGSLNEFTSKLPFQQQAFAKALGMTSEELTDILTRQQNIRDLGFNVYDMGIDDLKNKLDGITDTRKRMIVQEVLRSKRSLSFMESLGLAWDKIKDVLLGPLVEPLNRVLDRFVYELNRPDSAFAKVVSNLSDWLDNNFESTIKSIAGFLMNLPKMMNGLLEMLASDKPIFYSIGEKIGEGIMSGMGNAFGNLFYAMGDGLMRMIFGSFYPLVKYMADGSGKGDTNKSKSDNEKGGNPMDDATKKSNRNMQEATNNSKANEQSRYFGKPIDPNIYDPAEQHYKALVEAMAEFNRLMANMKINVNLDGQKVGEATNKANANFGPTPSRY